MFNQKEYLKKWHQEHPNYQKELRQKNLEAMRKRDRNYYQKNKKTKDERNNRQWQIKKDEYNLQRRIRYQKDKELILKRNKTNFQRNGKKYYRNQKQQQKDWREKNPEKVLDWSVKLLKREAKSFNLSVMEYKMALMAWSKTVRKRDKVCQICGTDKNLQAHHIIHRSKQPELSFVVNNGITLCKKCHNESHNKTSTYSTL